MSRRALFDAAPPAIVHVEIGGDDRCGQWVDLREHGVDADRLAAVVRGSESASKIAVRCPDPGPLFEHVGAITPDATVELRSALATVARRRGHESAKESELTAVREKLAALSLDDCDATAARRAVADAGDAERELAERVATLRGRLRERGESDELSAQLDDAVAELSEVRTGRIAAEQRLARERERARELRTRRERRLELQDRERNLERAVRADLAAAVYPAFADALAAVPGPARPGDSPSAFRGDDADAALALARLSPSPAPVVLGVDRFASPATAARRLGRPVLRV
ncbi:hypothetical protein [Natronoarchaeum mannanilyticum]|uniref:Uncharacterized protein n=1 Tax=Natronoarchaeum mannanilyticum TaxID=926360 RepID=A0AAV3T7R6_9EURY